MTGRHPQSFVVLATAVVLAACVGGCSSEPESSLIAFPGAPGSAQPRLASDLDGSVLLSWLEPEGNQRVLKFARVDAGGVAASREVVRSERMFVNWADFPSVTPITDALWFAHWLRRRPDSGAYDVATRISTDGGMSWSDAEQMNEDEAEAEHGFVEVFPWGGNVAAFWLDGREFANWSFDDPDALLGTSLRLARYDATGVAAAREIVDDMVCDCCAPDVAFTTAGPVVAYRDRTESEIRDIVVRRFEDGRWSETVGVGNEGWFIEGCPVNGPAIAAQGDEVVVVWFTAADGRGRVRFARSRDAGATFSAPIDVDADGAYGQPDVVLDNDGRAVLSWWRRGAENGIDLMVRAYDRDGAARAELAIGHEPVGQPVDVPQLIRSRDGYLAAWTTFDDNGDGVANDLTVRLAALDL
ncbi:MAG TPA: hypothetical protein VMR74_14430 [Gammaproteobacteria bacterium]|nr:hypothetical protein [Gammaproteobacteria bacterium]